MTSSVDGSSTVTATAPSSAPPVESTAAARPRFRGLSHQLAFFVAVPLGVVFAPSADTSAGRASAIAYGATVAFMFGASGAYHRISWSVRWRPMMRRIDHAGVYLLIAGSYTPIGLLILDGSWRLVVLAVVWAGAVFAIILKVCWIDAPKWLAASIAITLGWVARARHAADHGQHRPHRLPAARRRRHRVHGRRDRLRRGAARTRVPAVFGYHEVFHVLVIVAVALQWRRSRSSCCPSH